MRGKQASTATDETAPPPGGATMNGPQDKSVGGALPFPAMPEPQPMPTPTHEAAKLNGMHALAVEINAADLVVEQKKNELTKARKDRESLVQKLKAEALEMTLPLERSVLRAVDAVAPGLFNTATGLPNPAALSDPAAVVERAKGKRGKAKGDDADRQLAQARRDAAAVALPPPPAQGFVALSETPFDVATLQGAADAWAGGRAEVLTMDGNTYAVLSPDAPDWPGADWGPGVYCLARVVKDKEFRQLGATMPADEGRTGKLFGTKIKDQDGKPWLVSTKDHHGYVVTPDADQRLLDPAAAAPAFIDGRAAGLLHSELVEAVATATALDGAAGEQIPTVQLVRAPGGASYAVLSRYQGDEDQEQFDVVAAVLGEAWTGDSRNAAEARDDELDPYHGAVVRNLDGTRYVLAGPVQHVRMAPFVPPDHAKNAAAAKGERAKGDAKARKGKAAK